jgi:Mg2+ and Co2+ transporter CorA
MSASKKQEVFQRPICFLFSVIALPVFIAKTPPTAKNILLALLYIYSGRTMVSFGGSSTPSYHHHEHHQYSTYQHGGGAAGAAQDVLVDVDGTSPSLLEAGLKGLSISETSPLLSNRTSTSGSESDLSTRSSVVPSLPGMQLRAHVMEKGVRHIRSVPVKEAIMRSNKNKHAQYWIDIDADQDKDRAEMTTWFTQQLPFLPPFILSRLAEPSQTWASQVVALDTAILAVIRILPMVEEDDSSSSDQVDDTDCYMAAVVVDQLLLTFTSGPRHDICGLYDKALSYMNARENPTNSTDALFGWVYFHIERTSRALRELRYSVLKMDEAMDRDIHHVPMRQLIDAKDLLLKIFSVAEEQHECLEALQGASTTATTTTGPSPSNHCNNNNNNNNGMNNSNHNNGNHNNNITFSPGTLAVLVAQSAAAERMAVRLEKQLCDLRQRHESHQHDRMNRRLAMLTAMSAVFLPLTLITGIWGT